MKESQEKSNEISELKAKIRSLQSVIGGLRTTNNRYRNTVESLQKQVNVACEHASTAESDVEKLSILLSAKEKDLCELRKENARLKNKIDDLKKPWWKRFA